MSIAAKHTTLSSAFKELLKSETSAVMKINAALSVLGLLPFTKKERKTVNFN